MVDIDSKASRVDISIYDIVNDSDTPPDGSSVADEDGGDAVESFVGDVVAEADAHFDSVGDRANEKERQGQGQGQGQDQDQDENSAEREYSCQGQSDGAADPHDSAEKGGDSCSCQGQPDDNADPHDSTEKGGDEGNDIIPLPDPDGVPSQDAESSPADVAVVENEEAFGTKKGTESLGKEFSSTWAPKHPKPINEGTTESNISRDHEYALDVDVAQAPWTRAMKAWEEKQSKQDAAIDYDTAGMEEGQKDIQSAAITVNNMNGVEPSNTAEVQQSGNNNRGPQPSIRWYNRNQGLLWKLTIAVLVVVVIILGIILGVTLGDEKSSSESSNKKLGETNEEFDKGPINTLDEADPYPPAARPYSICVAIDLSDSDKSGCAPEITCEDVTIGNRTCCGIFFDLVEGVKDTIQTLDYYVSSKHAFSVVEFTNDAALSPVPNKNTTATFSVLELSNVGNNGEPVGVYPLKQCQGDCNSDEDCEGSLSCFQRADTAVVPGCVGLGTSRYDVDYCTDLAIKGIHLVATDMLSTENVLTTLDQLTYAGRKASHAEAIDACRLSLASSSTNLNEQKFMLLITDGDPVQFSGTHQINAETAAVQAKADGVFIIPLVITNAQSWLHPDFSTYYNEGISSDGFAFLLTEYFGGGTLPQGGIYLPEEIMSRVWQLGTVDNCRERTRPDFDSLNNFCGHCLWKKSEINCFQRVKFMTTNFGGTDMSTAKKLMGAGQCIDERSKDELEEARKEGTEHWCEGCEFEGTTCESYIKQSTQGVGSTNAKKLALMKEGYCKLPPYCNTNEIWGPMETGSAVSKYCGFQQYQVSYAQCDVPCLKNSDCVRALGMGSWKCQSFDSCNDTGDNEGEELEPNQPKSELLPSPSPASDVVSENEKLVCSDTPGWADSAGDGCEWYESHDDPGCPNYGHMYEGTMGVSNDNCCYCSSADTVRSSNECGGKDIQTKFTSSMTSVYDDRGSGANNDFSDWRPDDSSFDEWYSLGDAGLPRYGSAPSNGLLVKAPGDILMPPLDYSLIWKDSGSGGDMDGSFWEPIPPTGYTCLGHVVQPNYRKPSTNLIRCIKTSYVTDAGKSWLWTDAGSGADWDASVYQVESQQPDSLGPNTLITRRSHVAPDARHFKALNMKCIDEYSISVGTDPAIEKYLTCSLAENSCSMNF
mmetsp:Transcript_2963/g.6500  ORF Transcript_2963/g.6500 Transcript_2963/m.6500 type:complete len:1161 (+) Transcript_2963:145-3627(+)